MNSLGIRRFNQQPQSDFGLDWSNPLTRGLILSAFNYPSDYIGPPRNWVTRSATSSVRNGASFGSTFAGDQSVILPTFNGTTESASIPVNLAVSRQTTFSFWGQISTNSVVDAVVMEYSPTWATNAGFNFSTDDGAGHDWVVGVSGTGGTGGSNYDQATITTRPAVPGFHHYSIGVDRNVTTTAMQFIRIDGVSAAFTRAGSFVASDWLANSSIYIAARNNGSFFQQGGMAYLNIHSRLLTSGESQALYQNSAQILRGYTMRKLARSATR